MPGLIQSVPVQTADPLFNPDAPPLLSEHHMSEIEGSPPIYGVSQLESGAVAFDIWGRLKAVGGEVKPLVGNLYLGVNIGGITYDQTEPRPHVNVGQPFLFKADLIVTDLWKLVEGPSHTSRDGADSFTEEFISSVEQVRSVSKTIEMGISATVGAEGFGMSAEVTATLNQSVTDLTELTKHDEHGVSRNVVRNVEKGHTYALWRKYRRIDLKIKPEYAAGNSYEPFHQSVIERLLPTTITCFNPLSDWGDIDPPLPEPTTPATTPA